MLEETAGVRRPDNRPVLLYSAGCGPCRRLSVLALLLAGGLVRRCEVCSAEAVELLADRPDLRGRLVLISNIGFGGGGAEYAVGWGVFPALPRVVALALFAALSPVFPVRGRMEGE